MGKNKSAANDWQRWTANMSPDTLALNTDKAPCATETIDYGQLRQAGDLGAGGGQALEAMQPANALAAKFEHLWAEWGGPPLAKEYKFHTRRRWRFDYYHEPTKTAVEIHGGVWSNGRHVRGSGFLNDLEKLNAAAMQGITVLQLGTGQVDAAHVAEIADYVRRQMKQVHP
jgi:hypothetical protein